MSMQPSSADPTDYQQGFFERNTWIRPLVGFVVLCFGLLSVIITVNAVWGWLGGRFGQVLFGMIASMIFMSVVLATILLLVNGSRYLIEQYYS